MFLINLTYSAPVEVLDQWLVPHRAVINEFLEKGLIVFAGRKVPRSGGVIVFNTTDRALVDDFIARDPFKTQGIANFEVIEFNLTQAGSELAAFLPVQK